jgi:hypothetical protein
MEQHDADRSLAGEALRAAAARAPAEAALALAELLNRAAVELHKVARAESQTRRGQADWGAWAKLANAARTAVLHAASCRDAARGLSADE